MDSQRVKRLGRLIAHLYQDYPHSAHDYQNGNYEMVINLVARESSKFIRYAFRVQLS